MNHVMKRQPDESTEPDIPHQLIVHPHRHKSNQREDHKLLPHRQGEPLVGGVLQMFINLRETPLQRILIAVEEHPHPDNLLQIVEDKQQRKSQCVSIHKQENVVWFAGQR